MADAGNGLRIKYGLGIIPSQFQITEWARLTRQYISRGFTLEQAGDRAARETFNDYQTHKYASEADTIATLLEAIEQK